MKSKLSTPMLVLGLILGAVLLSGCQTSRRYSTNMIRKSERISPKLYGADLRSGVRGAVVAFNTDVECAESEGGGRMTKEELRQLTDAMFVAFMREFTALPGLEQVKPVKEIQQDRYYRVMDYPRGDGIHGFTLTRGNGRRCAPRGLKYIPVPHSEFARPKGVLSLRDSFRNVKREFEGDLSHLARQLEVDFVVVVSNKVMLRKFDGVWGAELALMEVVISGHDSPRRYEFANHVMGRFSEPGAGEPQFELSPELSTLLQPKQAYEFDATAIQGNRYWRTLATPYTQISGLFRDKMARLRESD